MPPLLPRFLAVSQNRYVPIEDVIAAHLTDLFGGVEVIEQHAFRVTRIRDLEVDEDITENLLQAMERELVRRRFEPAVRLEVEDTMSADVLDRLVTELDIDARAVYRVPGPLDLSGLFAIADLNIGELRYPAFVPSTRAVPQDGSIFTAIAERDILVQHPYDSFAASVERLIEEAAEDPGVLAIKQTLYRTSGQSPIVDALIDAAEAGKQVVVVVEIKARFDERANITWARKLEEAGCHVVYGFVGLKTHCKMALIVRAGARRDAAPLLPPRHRQLPPDHGPGVRGLRPAHRRSRGRRGRHRAVQPPHRVQPHGLLPPAAGRAGGAAQRHREPDRRGRPSGSGPACPPGSRSSPTRSSTRW